MKWYSPTPCDNTVANPLVVDTGSIDVTEVSPFKVGRAIEKWPETHWLKASSGDQDGDPDDVLQSYLFLPIYSSRLRKALEAIHIDRIQYLPISIYTSTDQFIKGYYIANFLDCVPALDLARSKYSRYGPDWAEIDMAKVGCVSGVLRATLVGSALAGRDIIRTKEFVQCYFVSQRFKHIFESHGFTGYSFREVGVT